MILHSFAVESKIMENFESIVITGDINMVQNHLIDASIYCTINNPDKRKKLYN